MADNDKKQSSHGRRLIRSILLIGLCAPLICNDLPIYLEHDGHHYFPFANPGGFLVEKGDTSYFRSTDFRIGFDDWLIVRTPIVYSPGATDFPANAFRSPFDGQRLMQATGYAEMPWRFRHWLGTDRTGKDVLSNLFFGLRTSLIVGCGAMILAFLIGLSLGFISGFTSGGGLRTTRYMLLFALSAFPMFVFQVSQALKGVDITGGLIISVTCLFLLWLICTKILSRLDFLRRGIDIRIDDYLSTFISGFTVLPQLIVATIIMAMTGPSYHGLIASIGFTAWPVIARVVRSETMRIRSEAFIDSATIAGSSPWRLAVRHFLPNMIESLAALLISGFAGSVLMEAGLTFLGIGLPSGTPSWGALMATARADFSAWWMVVFPGLFLTLLLYGLNRVSPMKKVSKINKL